MNPKDLVGAKKAPLGLVPAAGAIMSAPAHQIGADKYGPFNWRDQPVQVMTYVEAVFRHLHAFVDGQDHAEDTGVHHIGHAIAGLNILADALSANNVIDNRPAKGPAADLLRAQDKSIKLDVEGIPIGCHEHPLGCPGNHVPYVAQNVLDAMAYQACPLPGCTPKEHRFDCPNFHLD